MLFGNKRGISVVVGYVLLITFVIFLGAIIYTWMKTYVPQEELDCPEDVSIFVKDYECGADQLNITLKNNGKFNIGGYFIRVTDVPGLGLATIDISQNITYGGTFLAPSGVKFSGTGENTLTPNIDEEHRFDISDYYPIYSVEILPLRWQEHDEKLRVVTCKGAVISEKITCS